MAEILLLKQESLSKLCCKFKIRTSMYILEFKYLFHIERNHNVLNIVQIEGMD